MPHRIMKWTLLLLLLLVGKNTYLNANQIKVKDEAQSLLLSPQQQSNFAPNTKWEVYGTQ